MDHFYCPPDHIYQNDLFIDGEEFAHMTHVMRKKVGDVVRVVDGLGHAFDAKLSGINRKSARGMIVSSYSGYNESSTDVTLGVGVLKNPSKYDFLVEKVTELGARRIIPLITERTIPSHAKVGRWRKLALAAMKQSGRSYLPSVSELMTLDELLAQRDGFALRIIAHEEFLETPRLSSSAGSVLILVGPEGGFSPEEVERCRGGGFHTMYLGERRLRTETAAVVMAALWLLPPARN